MTPTPPRSGWTLQRCESFDDMRVQAIRRWQRVSATARAAAAWDLVVEAWSLKKRPLTDVQSCGTCILAICLSGGHKESKQRESVQRETCRDPKSAHSLVRQ